MIIYHYTSIDNFNSINASQKIYPSNPWTAMDAYAGNGWYFTDLPPHRCDLEISKICWMMIIEDRVEC